MPLPAHAEADEPVDHHDRRSGADTDQRAGEQQQHQHARQPPPHAGHGAYDEHRAQQAGRGREPLRGGHVHHVAYVPLVLAGGHHRATREPQPALRGESGLPSGVAEERHHHRIRRPAHLTIRGYPLRYAAAGSFAGRGCM